MGGALGVVRGVGGAFGVVREWEETLKWCGSGRRL